MPKNLMLTFALAMGVGTGGSALAALELIPSGTQFELKGTVIVSVESRQYKCKLTMMGMTYFSGARKSKTGIIKSVGNSLKGCTVMYAGFPWYIALSSKTGGMISNATYGDDTGECAHQGLPLTISKSGLWRLSGPGSCTFSGDLRSAPKVTIGK